MKTYLLREPKTVEPQSHRRQARVRSATVSEMLGRPAAREERALRQGPEPQIIRR